jgi:hypothetical protein
MARAPRRTKSPTLARPPARRPLIRNTEGKGKRRVENRAIADSPRSRVPDGGATARSRDSSSDEHDDLPHGAHSEADADAFFDMLRAPGWNRRALPAETALVNTGNPVIGRRTKKLKDTGKVKVRAEVTLYVHPFTWGPLVPLSVSFSLSIMYQPLSASFQEGSSWIRMETTEHVGLGERSVCGRRTPRSAIW